MKWIQVVETFDKKQHENALKAEKHLDRLYGDMLTSIAHDLVKCDGKYKATVDFIDANLQRFVNLATIKANMPLEDVDSD